MARDPDDIVELGAIGPHDQILIHCGDCRRDVRWTARDIPKHLPHDMRLRALEPRLRCIGCYCRGNARINFWRPAR